MAAPRRAVTFLLAATVLGAAACAQHRAIGPTAGADDGGTRATVERHVSAADPQEAITMLDREVASAPERSEPRLRLCAMLLQGGALERAEECGRTAVAGWPRDAQAHLLLAYALAEGDAAQKVEALRVFETAARLAADPEQQIAAHLGMAALHEDTGDLARANEQYEQALAIEPALRDVLVGVQKELLWGEPTLPGGDGEGHGFGDPGRRARIEEEVTKMLKRRGGP